MKTLVSMVAIALSLCLGFGTLVLAAEMPEGKMSKPWIGVPKLRTMVVGTKVLTTQGQELGTIERVVLSDGECIKYIVLSHDGRLIPIPWRAVKVSPEKHAVILRINQKALNEAPVVERNQWTELDDRKIAQFYTRPYGFWTDPDVSDGPFTPDTGLSDRKNARTRNKEAKPDAAPRQGKSDESSAIQK